MARHNWADKFDYNRDYVTSIPMDFLIDHLSKISYDKVFISDYLPERSQRIREALDFGIEPEDFEPIITCYYDVEDEIYIIDGVHRTKVFYERGIKQINSIFARYLSLRPLRLDPSEIDTL